MTRYDKHSSFHVFHVFHCLMSSESHAVRMAPGFIPGLSPFLSHRFTLFFSLFFFLDTVFPACLIDFNRLFSICDLLPTYSFPIPHSFFVYRPFVLQELFPFFVVNFPFGPRLFFMIFPWLNIHSPSMPSSCLAYSPLSPVSSLFISSWFLRYAPCISLSYQSIPHVFPLPFTPPVICVFTPHFFSIDVFTIYSIRSWLAVDAPMALGPGTHFSSLPRCFPCFVFILHLCSLFLPLLLLLFNFVDLLWCVQSMPGCCVSLFVLEVRLMKGTTLWSPVHVSLTLMGMTWEQMLVSSWQLVNA